MALQITTTVEFDDGTDPDTLQEFMDRYHELLERAFNHEFSDMGVFDYEVTYENE